ncbi:MULTISPECIES: metal-dependent hydrolase [Vibrio]|uniref:metal-dependent hydrolase n=1 Tax=Vibrio TaxID=662 RepID=UPI0001B941B5|nr:MULTISPECIES: metal-dependent hydrolase [Vibrio]EEX34538.1 hypothetical protein VIC_001338 [Vibrio coralliilyticus ATCC BAA-450]MDE3898583.1 metal-dependent hydrolase [Vibrio sp. CC007]
MDSVTQAALGATVAGAIAGKRCRPSVLLVGALLGTLPDLDVLLDYGDAVHNTIKHRGFSHSLLLLPPLALMLAWCYCRWRPDRYWSLSRVFFLTLAVLVTHPLLDAMTTYGTQLFWPFDGYYELRNVFIIDPLYTLPLLIAVGVALCLPSHGGRWSQRMLLLSTLYLGWGYLSQQWVATRVSDNLARQGLPNEHVLITPTPFNTLLWRVVVMDEDRYWEGFASVLDQEARVDFVARPLGKWPLDVKPETLLGLEAFSHRFLNYRQEAHHLIVSDLRLGIADQLSFEFVFAERSPQGDWQLLDTTWRYPSSRDYALLGPLWQRLQGDQSIHVDLPSSTNEAASRWPRLSEDRGVNL